MGQVESSDKQPRVSPVSGERVEVRPISSGNTGSTSSQANSGDRVRPLYPDVSQFEQRSGAPTRVAQPTYPAPTQSGGGGVQFRRSAAQAGNREAAPKDDGIDPLLPVRPHWNGSPSFQLRYLVGEPGRRDGAKLGADLDILTGKVKSFVKYKFDDFRLGIRGEPVPDEIFGSVGILGTVSNRLVMSVGYNFKKQEPMIGFKVKSNDVLRARVGGKSGAASNSPAGLDYKLRVNLSPTSRFKAVGSLDLPPQGIVFGEAREAIHLAVNSMSIKQQITRDFLANGVRDLWNLVAHKVANTVEQPKPTQGRTTVYHKTTTRTRSTTRESPSDVQYPQIPRTPSMPSEPKPIRATGS